MKTDTDPFLEVLFRSLLIFFAPLRLCERNYFSDFHPPMQSLPGKHRRHRPLFRPPGRADRI